MVRWVRDATGRFPQRPHYEPAELDGACEEIVRSFLKSQYGAVRYPIETDDLTVLIEGEAEELDLYADLSREGQDVQGETQFFARGRPRVRIARELTNQVNRENRLRTTLTHELGHVKFHSFLWGMGQVSMSGKALREASPRCYRESILHASRSDWMEWQAGYASGAFLMPVSAVKELVMGARGRASDLAPIFSSSPAGEELVEAVKEKFMVSSDAALVRLIKLRYLIEGEQVPSLFDARHSRT